MDIKRLKDYIEQIAEEVHNAWMQEKIEQGFHSPNECLSKSHERVLNNERYLKGEYEGVGNGKFCRWCDKCHADLYPYSELPENIKEYDRVTVRAVLNAIESIKE
jgi:hypothetical protein